MIAYSIITKRVLDEVPGRNVERLGFALGACVRDDDKVDVFHDPCSMIAYMVGHPTLLVSFNGMDLDGRVLLYDAGECGDAARSVLFSRTLSLSSAIEAHSGFKIPFWELAEAVGRGDHIHSSLIATMRYRMAMEVKLSHGDQSVAIRDMKDAVNISIERAMVVRMAYEAMDRDGGIAVTHRGVRRFIPISRMALRKVV